MYFLDKARSDFGVLLICAKDLFVEATASPHTMGPKAGCRLSQEAKRLLAKAENEGTAPFPLPKLAQWRGR